MILKYGEWQSPSGKWHCGDTSALGKNSNAWWKPARMLKMELTDYIKWVKDTYKASVHISADGSFVMFEWTKQNDMRKFKNYINKKARETGYQSY